jgi:hypothetical protein
MQQCDFCGEPLGPEETALGWPLLTDEGLICPRCLGYEAYCRQCGRLLNSDLEAWLCQACQEPRAPQS